MQGYQGEFPIDLDQTRFYGFTPADWAMEYVGRYGQIDGEHHKAWVLDQVARILRGTPVIVVEARWLNDGETKREMRFCTGDPSQEYLDWVGEMRRSTGEDEENEYDVSISV